MKDVARRLEEITSPTIDLISRHPFVTELTAGTLPKEVFARYVSQNYLYLGAYAKALALIAARSTDPKTVAFFARRAAYTIESEQAFATDLMRESGLDPTVFRHATPSPTCLAYSSFIKQAAALEPVPVALAAMLPCYVVYNGVAKSLVASGSPDALSQQWIDMYVDETFEEGTTGIQAAIDSAADGTSQSVIERMIDHARTASRYEWMFWESAYRGLDWPDQN